MGVPVVEVLFICYFLFNLQAPCEAEAQCAAMVKAGVAWATGTEDMDALTLGTPILLRHLNFSEARKMPIVQIDLDTILREMDFTMDMVLNFN